MSNKNPSHDDAAELTKAERTARDSVQESVENAVPAGKEAEEAAIVDPTVLEPTVIDSVVVTPPVLLGGEPVDASADELSVESDDLDDASASALVEARRDLT
jgi:hypothetical protein